jgi:hypothetical protein
VVLAIAPHRASGQPGPAESPSNIECVEHLEIPDYPPLALSAHIQGTQTVKVLVSNQATVQNIESSLQARPSTVEKDFRAGTEKALKNSRFSKTCGGKTITLVFHYELREDDNKSLFAFGPPNPFGYVPDRFTSSESGRQGQRDRPYYFERPAELPLRICTSLRTESGAG